MKRNLHRDEVGKDFHLMNSFQKKRGRYCYLPLFFMMLFLNYSRTNFTTVSPPFEIRTLTYSEETLEML